MKYYIAIDAGGTKTDSVLFDQEGHVLARDLRRGANAFDLGPMEAAARISGAVEMQRGIRRGIRRALLSRDCPRGIARSGRRPLPV